MQCVGFISLLFFLIGCNPRDNKGTIPQQTLQTNSRAQIVNGIVVHEKGGLEIRRAFLSYPDGRLLNSKNIVHPGDTVCLNLVVRQGWIAENGTVSIGATQTLLAENGERLLSSPDLFAGEPKMPQAKAAQLQLKTMLTKLRPGPSGFFVHYKVWDKTGPGEVSGHYRLQLSGNSAK
jgi:hypothetical protein